MNSEISNHAGVNVATVFVRVDCPDGKIRLLNLNEISYMEPYCIGTEAETTKVFMTGNKAPIIITTTLDQFFEAIAMWKERYTKSDS